MKKIIYSLSCCMIAGAFIACGGGAKNAEKKGTDTDSTKTTEAMKPEYTVLDKPQVDLSKFKKIKTDISLSSMAKHSTDGVVMEKMLFRENGLSTKELSNLMVAAAEKLRKKTAATLSLLTSSKTLNWN